MKTAVTEILNHCNSLLLEDAEIDTQGLVHWIEDTLLELEKEQMFKALVKGVDVHRAYDIELEFNEYYNETFKSE